MQHLECDALAQTLRLPDVEHGPLLIQPTVDAGAEWSRGAALFECGQMGIFHASHGNMIQ